jgi:hypothetical protein
MHYPRERQRRLLRSGTSGEIGQDEESSDDERPGFTIHLLESREEARDKRAHRLTETGSGAEVVVEQRLSEEQDRHPSIVPRERWRAPAKSL